MPVVFVDVKAEMKPMTCWLRLVPRGVVSQVQARMMETNTTMTVGGGTRAPQIPANAVVTQSHNYDGNQIIIYQKA